MDNKLCDTTIVDAMIIQLSPSRASPLEPSSLFSGAGLVMSSNDGSLSGKSETLALAHGRLQHSCLLVVKENTVDQVQTHPTGEGSRVTSHVTYTSSHRQRVHLHTYMHRHTHSFPTKQLHS